MERSTNPGKVKLSSVKLGESKNNSKLCVKFYQDSSYVFIWMSSLAQQKRPTKRAPDAGDSVQISSIFTRLIIFPVGRLRRPHPSAGNANRWLAPSRG